MSSVLFKWKVANLSWRVRTLSARLYSLPLERGGRALETSRVVVPRTRGHIHPFCPENAKKTSRKQPRNDPGGESP